MSLDYESLRPRIIHRCGMHKKDLPHDEAIFLVAAIDDLLAVKRAETDGTAAFDDGARFACGFLKDHPDASVRRIALDVARACIERRK